MFWTLWSDCLVKNQMQGHLLYHHFTFYTISTSTQQPHHYNHTIPTFSSTTLNYSSKIFPFFIHFASLVNTFHSSSPNRIKSNRDENTENNSNFQVRTSKQLSKLLRIIIIIIIKKSSLLYFFKKKKKYSNPRRKSEQQVKIKSSTRNINGVYHVCPFTVRHIVRSCLWIILHS